MLSNTDPSFLEAVIENIPHYVFVKDAKDLRFVMINKSLEKFLGKSKEEVIGKSDYDFFSKDIADFFVKKDHEVLSKKEVVFISEEPVESNGEVVYLRTKKVPILDSNGNPIYLLGIAEDATIVKDAELQLVEAQKMSKIGSWFFDVETQKITWSAQMYSLFPENIEDGEPSFEKHRSSIHPDDVDHWESVVGNSLEKGEAYEMFFRTIHDDGKVLWIKTIGKGNFDSEGKITSLSGTCQDVTEFKLNESLIKYAGEIRRFFQQNPEDHSALFEKILEAILKITESEYGFIGKVLNDKDGNPYLKTYALTNIAWNEETRDFYEKNAPEGLEFVNLNTLFGEVLKTGKPLMTNDSKNHKKAGGIPEGHPSLDKFMGVPIFNGKNFVAMFGVANRKVGYNSDLLEFLKPLIDSISDILILIDKETKEQMYKEEIIKERNFVKKTLDSMPAIFYAKDLDGKFIHINEPFREFFGAIDEDIIGKDNHEIFPKEVADQFRENDLRIIKSKETEETEEIAIGKTGEARTFKSFKYPYIDSCGEVFATGGVSLDITEAKQLERQAYHSSKLAAIGELAAGVGHEINNPLAIIKSYLFRLKHDYDKEKLTKDSLYDLVLKMDGAVNRASSIVKGLKTFSRSDHDQRVEFDISKMVRESVEMLQELYPRDGVALGFAENVRDIQIEGNEGRLQQVLVNLISNAKDATEGQEVREVVVETHINNKKFIFIVRDNGPGIPESFKEKVFNPFFTTKDVGKGTGMGLAIVHGIIENHLGEISFESSPEKGTAFKITLPIKE